MLDVAIEAAKKAGELTLKYFRQSPQISYKADKTPLTKADVESERLIRKIISKKFPDHGFIGEEFGKTNPDSNFQWCIDPIDGNRYFAHKLPYWGILIAVLLKNRPIIGVSYMPVLNQLLVAEKGKGSFLNGRKTKVSNKKDLMNSSIANGSISYFEDIGKLENLVKLYRKVRGGKVGIGGIYGYSLVAQGIIDICVDPKSEVYDIAAPSIIVEEAGGKFSDFHGKSFMTSGSFVATNGLLHDQVLKILNDWVIG